MRDKKVVAKEGQDKTDQFGTRQEWSMKDKTGLTKEGQDRSYPWSQQEVQLILDRLLAAKVGSK